MNIKVNKANPKLIIKMKWLKFWLQVIYKRLAIKLSKMNKSIIENKWD